MVRRVTLTRIIQLQHNKFIFLKVRTESLMLTWQLQVFIKKTCLTGVCVCVYRKGNESESSYESTQTNGSFGYSFTSPLMLLIYLFNA